jgi:hypothetical protein
LGFKKASCELIDLLVSEHQKQLAANSQGIDYRKVLSKRSWPFYAFAKAIVRLLGKEEGRSSFTAEELEALKKFYNQNPGLTEPELTRAFARTQNKSLPYLIHELTQILQILSCGQSGIY